MTPKKQYLAERFSKLSRHDKTIKSILDFNFKLLQSDYHSLSLKDFNKIKQKYGIDEYNKRMLDVIDKYFTEDELEKLVAFFSTNLGRKISEITFIEDLGKKIKDMVSEAEAELSLLNKKRRQ